MMAKLFALFLFAVFLGACSGGAIVMHARAAEILAPIITTAGSTILDARATERDACADEPCLDAVLARWAPAVAAYNLTREGWVGWVNAMALAALAHRSDEEAQAILLPLLFSLFELYEGIRLALDPISDLELPSIPALGLGGR